MIYLSDVFVWFIYLVYFSVTWEWLKPVLELDMKIKSLKESDGEHLLNVLEKNSRLLKIPLQSVKSKIKVYGISRSDPKGS